MEKNKLTEKSGKSATAVAAKDALTKIVYVDGSEEADYPLVFAKQLIDEHGLFRLSSGTEYLDEYEYATRLVGEGVVISSSIKITGTGGANLFLYTVNTLGFKLEKMDPENKSQVSWAVYYNVRNLYVNKKVEETVKKGEVAETEVEVRKFSALIIHRVDIETARATDWYWRDIFSRLTETAKEQNQLVLDDPSGVPSLVLVHNDSGNPAKLVQFIGKQHQYGYSLVDHSGDPAATNKFFILSLSKYAPPPQLVANPPSEGLSLLTSEPLVKKEVVLNETPADIGSALLRTYGHALEKDSVTFPSEYVYCDQAKTVMASGSGSGSELLVSGNFENIAPEGHVQVPLGPWKISTVAGFEGFIFETEGVKVAYNVRNVRSGRGLTSALVIYKSSSPSARTYVTSVFYHLCAAARDVHGLVLSEDHRLPELILVNSDEDALVQYLEWNKMTRSGQVANGLKTVFRPYYRTTETDHRNSASGGTKLTFLIFHGYLKQHRTN